MTNNKLKLFFISAVVLITLSACNNTRNTVKTNTTDTHTAQISLDWQGTYSGILPCADCEGIDTEITLYKDLSYVLVSKYLGKENTQPDTLKGKFTWEGNNISLDGIPQNERPSKLKVEENQLRYLDMDGKEITGNLAQNYVMRKNGNPAIENKKWHLIELNGKPVKGSPKTHYIIFHSEEGRVEAKANCNIMLRNYKIKNELRLKIESGISTMMACPDDLEDQLVKVLDQVDNCSSDGKTLSLNKGRMAPLARFELAKE